MDFSPETLRARFAELTAAHDAIEAQLAPLRADLEVLVAGAPDLTVAEARTREAQLRSAIKAHQATLFPIEQERAALSRALGGKTAG